MRRFWRKLVCHTSLLKSGATKAQISKLEAAILTNDYKQINLEAENLEKFAEQLAENKMDKVIGKTLVGKKIDEV